ncbi:MAG TPA: dihydrofolate reductase [Bacteriovoracaceae bacterium]|nr:dihydrofolate reductase [Bacteriovoracaceae bacterium]
MKVKLIAIAALGKNREIGLNGKVPWDLPDEYARFRETIKGQYVIIGRKNFELHGKKVNGAHPLVLTLGSHYEAPNALVFQNIVEIISYAEGRNIEKLYVMGGGQIYKLALPYLSEFLWTEVDYSGPADSYFPDFSMFDWTQVSEENHQTWKLRHLVKIPHMPY